MDEAWRWPLYWPLYIGLVVSKSISEKALKKHQLFKDSKALTAAQREVAFEEIFQLKKEWKIDFQVWSIDAKSIDVFWVTRAINLAVMKALYVLLINQLWKKAKKKISIGDVAKLVHEYEEKFETIEIVFDGKTDFKIGKELWIATSTIVHWDANVVQIAMASILAKVSRDQLLDEIAVKHPKYWFEKHKGYWTKLHYEAIENYWVLKDHRKLYLKKIFPERKIKNYDKNLSFSLN